MDTTTGNGSWTEVTQTASGTENKIRCDGLKPLHKYRFRVKAVNKIGISDPGEMKGPDILMKDPWGKYTIRHKSFSQRLTVIFNVIYLPLYRLTLYFFIISSQMSQILQVSHKLLIGDPILGK